MAGYEDKSFKWIGTRPVRPDGVDKVTGRANYGADMKLPGQLTGRILRSPHAHAKILSIDTSKAEKLPGVKAVITGKDFPEMHNGVLPGDEGVNFHYLSCNIMARNKVLYDGHAVAAVAATSAAIAEEALALIEVKYEVLPHVIDVDLALKPGAPLLHDDIFTTGVTPETGKAIQHRAAHSDAAWAIPMRRSRMPMWLSNALSRPRRCIRAISSPMPWSRNGAKTANAASGAAARGILWSVH